MEFDKPIALVIGINHYLGYRSLKGAVGDACDMERWLVEQQGLPKNNIRRLLSPDPRPKDDQLQNLCLFPSRCMIGLIYWMLKPKGMGRIFLSVRGSM